MTNFFDFCLAIFWCIVWIWFKVRLTKQCLGNLRKNFSWILHHFLLLWTLLKWKDLLILWRTSEYSTTTHASKTCKITPWRQKYENLFLYTSYELTVVSKNLQIKMDVIWLKNEVYFFQKRQKVILRYLLQYWSYWDDVNT